MRVPSGVILGLVMSVLCLAAPRRAQALSVHLLVGMRQLTDDTWDDKSNNLDVSAQTSVGIMVELPRFGLPVSLEVGALYSFSDDSSGTVKADATVTELFAGVRKTWILPVLRPYIGAGLSIAMADLELKTGSSSLSDDDSLFGLSVHGGAYLKLMPNLSVGLDVRYLVGTDGELFTTKGDVDGFSLAATVGWHF